VNGPTTENLNRFVSKLGADFVTTQSLESHLATNFVTKFVTNFATNFVTKVVFASVQFVEAIYNKSKKGF
jgi:hypothetical protein